MARVKVRVTTRLSASTIVEVLVAMVVMMVVFGIAMGIITNVQRLSLSVKKIHAEAVLQEEILKLEQAPVVSKETINKGDLRIEEDVTQYNSNNSLYLIDLVTYDDNQDQVAEFKEVFYESK